MQFILLFPWKFKKSPTLDMFQFYEKRLSQYVKFSVDHPKSLLKSAKDEHSFLEKACEKYASQNYKLIFLDEGGDTFSSNKMAKKVEQMKISGTKGVVFCMGGAYGLPASLKKYYAKNVWSLSLLTLPHELAAVVTTEALYRSFCILAGHPYHHGETSGLMS